MNEKKMNANSEEWLFEITPKNRLLSLNLKEVWKYRDLLFLFVHRNIITEYKQTILGPLWYLIQPLFTALTFTLIFNKVIIHSPVIRKDPKYFVPHGEVLDVSIDKLIQNRIGNISDKLIPKPNRVDGWKEKILSVIGKTEWKVPAKVVHDVGNYYPKRNNTGFNPNSVPPILSIIGEYDYEITTGGYALFKDYFPNIKEVIIPNSTHFSMWENEYKMTLHTVRDYVQGT